MKDYPDRPLTGSEWASGALQWLALIGLFVGGVWLALGHPGI